MSKFREYIELFTSGLSAEDIEDAKRALGEMRGSSFRLDALSKGLEDMEAHEGHGLMGTTLSFASGALRRLHTLRRKGIESTEHNHIDPTPRTEQFL